MRRSLLLLFILFCVGAGLKAQVESAFTSSAQFGCPPLVVSFTNTSTGGPTSYKWDFGNGNTATTQNVTTSFPTPGIYNVSLIAINGASSDTAFMQIRVFQPPKDSFTSVSPTGCSNPCHLDSFINLTIPGESPVTQYVWDFGDGTLPVQGYSVTHCFSHIGNFQVTLVSRDSNGCQTSKVIPNYEHISKAPTATVAASPAQSCNNPQLVNFTGTGSSNNGPVTYAWYFGNGQTSAQQDPSTVYNNGIFNPMMIVTDSLGCTDTASATVQITDVQAGFTSSTTNGCAGIAIQFTDTSNFSASWSWNFGDGSTSTQRNPSHAYATTGSYTVTLTVSYNGCTSTVTETNYITVTNPVSFTLSGDNTSGCVPPLTVNFTSTASGATAYLWKFGDNTTSTLASPSHTYNTAGSFSVSLSVTNSAGCVNTQTVNNYITIGGIHAKFTVDSTNGCAPLTVHFTNTSTSNVPITSYRWDFGDGSTSGQPNPAHTYSAGNYIPVLIVTNQNGCSDTFVSPDTIKAGDALIPNFVATPLLQCVDQQIQFTNLTQGTGPNTLYTWHFGDGSISNLPNPMHEYSDTGKYNITLVVTNQGCRSDTVRIKYIEIIVPKSQFLFNFNCSTPTSVAFIDTSVGADTWLWEFGDGTTSNLQNPGVHNYATQGNYTVTLIVSNASTGCVDSSKQTLPIGAAHANFGATVTSGCAPLNVIFLDSSVFANRWSWNFGDSTTNQARNPAHTYADTGRYTVTLIINPGGGCADTMTKVNYITVYGIIGHMVPSPHGGCVPLNVAFKDSSTSFLGSINSWDWQFGDGDSSHLQNPSYTYNTLGNYNATLRVTDTHGCHSNLTAPIVASKPTAFFTSDTIVCPGEQAHFVNQSQNANGYIWLFGDGSTSAQMNPTHAYNVSGSYIVSLIAMDTTYGCRDTFVSPNPVHVDTPVVDFTVNSTFSPCPPFPVQFSNLTNRAGLSWLWYFGDGDTSSATNPLHVYFFPGDYNVELIAKDTFGCVGRKEYIDLIRVRGPIGHFLATPDTGCVPLAVSITGSVFSTVNIVADLGDGTTYTDTLNLTHVYTQPGTYYPVYTLTDSLNCTVAYPVDTIVVGLIPYPNLPPDTTVCKGNYVEFNLPLGDHFQWTSNLSNTYLTCDTCKNTLSTSPDTITYYVTAITNIGCVAKDTITVNVDALPHIFPGVSYKICPHDTLQLHAGPDVTSATWTPDLYISDTTIANPEVWTPDTMTYRVTGANELGCSVSRVVTIYPISKVEASVSVPDTSICNGNPISMQVTVLDAASSDTSYFWTPPNYLNANNIQDPVATPPVGIYNYQVIVKSATCVSDTSTVHIVVAADPDIQAGDNQTVAVGTKVQLWADSHQDVNYFWTPSVDSFSCNDCRRPFVTVTQNQTVYVIAENSYGCKAGDSVVLKVVGCDSKMVFVPNTFTPNGDGANDKLFVRGIGLSKLEYFRVFDRWGRIMFQTNSMDEGWDGTTDGKAANLGTYVYIVKGICTSGSDVEMSGNVTLIR